MKAKYLLCFILIVISCKSSDNDIYKFDPEKIKETGISLSEIANDIIYIPLDNTFPIDFIASYELVNNIFYVPNKKFGLLTFSIDGKFKRVIGKVGRGPGEYINCNYFVVDNKQGRIYILDIDQEIKVFSTDGDFLRSIQLNEYDGNFSKIGFNDSKIFLFEFFTMGQAKYNWIIIDTLGVLLNQKKNTVPPFKSVIVGGGGIYISNNKISYWNLYNDSVFSISSDFNYETSILISPGPYRLPKSNFGLDQFSQYLMPFNIFETSHLLVFHYKYKDRETLTLIGKKNRNAFSTSYKFTKGYYSGSLNDLDGGIMLMPTNYYSDQDHEYLLGTIEPYQIKSLLDNEEFKNFTPKYPKKKKELEKLANVIDENSNPILILAKLK